ncbi:MAG: tRNA uridine-5-carboxymethylaminomethyl(34) synthesis GTPase MnmE [Saprospiraceae bacterium]|nr:tRNA uridine-5-carboxymethylaminomethyl(34) synthesis GTPase MnmE [Saprospiraceae bacterium]
MPNQPSFDSYLCGVIQLSDTIVAIATPPGLGAIGIVRLSGVNAITIADGLFHGKTLAEVNSHTLHFGLIKDGDGQVVDEVVASVFKAPKSYTGENIVEFSCHGSNYILQKVLELCMWGGARLAQPGEFTQRAFLNGKMDLASAEGVADLIASENQAAHQIALKQMRGGFTKDIQQLREKLVHFASMIELELDFGEEDVEFADRSALITLVKEVLSYIYKLTDSFQLGNAIKQGVTTVLAGRPNAGKSTLLNALLNEDRAIVSDIAGTTRDPIEESLNIKGIQFRLVDTAGIREAGDAIEKIGVEKTLEKVQQSSLLVYVFDVTELTPFQVRQDLEKLIAQGAKPTATLAIANKMDLFPTKKPDDYAFDELPKEHIIAASALNKMNIEHLKDSLYHVALSQELSQGNTIVSNARHFEALSKAAASLESVITGINDQVSNDFVAMDIRHALAYLGEITGEITTDDLLANIFSKFCIGK